MSFAAIDFETANYRSDSPCQVAVVIFEDGQLVSEHTWLIRPRDMVFSDRCIAVHGILPRDVVDQPEWDEVWPELWPLIDGRVLLAHNAMFDMAVLNATLSTYGIDCPRIDFQCTRLIARRCWPGRTGYGLKPTADMLGLSFQHHVAVEDARICGQVALAAARTAKSVSLESLERDLYIQRGFVEGRQRVGPRTIRRPKSAKTALRTPVETIAELCGELRPFAGKRFFLHGQLLGMERENAVAFLEKLGAAVDDQAGEATDFWLMGMGEAQVEPAPASDNSALRAPYIEAAKSPGKVTRIISQRQFLAMIPGGMEAIRKLVDARAY